MCKINLEIDFSRAKVIKIEKDQQHLLVFYGLYAEKIEV